MLRCKSFHHKWSSLQSGAWPLLPSLLKHQGVFLRWVLLSPGLRRYTEVQTESHEQKEGALKPASWLRFDVSHCGDIGLLPVAQRHPGLQCGREGKSVSLRGPWWGQILW